MKGTVHPHLENRGDDDVSVHLSLSHKIYLNTYRERGQVVDLELGCICEAQNNARNDKKKEEPHKIVGPNCILKKKPVASLLQHFFSFPISAGRLMTSGASKKGQKRSP